VLLLGFLSVLQVIFLPGFVFLKIIKIKMESKVQIIIYSLAFSLIFNYLLVFLLVAFNIYTSLIMYLVFALEVLYIYIKKNENILNIEFNLKKDFVYLRSGLRKNSFSYNLLFLFSLMMITLYFYFFYENLGTVFLEWDPIVSWNRWAVNWFNNILPGRVWGYPQLIPVNWSITYVFIGTSEIQFFAKSIMPLFSIAILFIFTSLGMLKKQLEYFLSAVIFGIFLYFYVKKSFIVSGYVDIPVAFFALLAFYVIWIYKQDSSKLNISILFSTAFASAAAITKQSGLYILIIVSLYNVFKLYKSSDNFKLKLFLFIKFMLIILVIVIPWYLYFHLKTQNGNDGYLISFLTNTIHKGRDYIERFQFGLNHFNKIINELILFSAYFGFLIKFLFYIIPLIILASIIEIKSRFTTLFVTLPYTLIWFFFYSYDKRNLLFVLPFIAFSASFGVKFIIDRIKRQKLLNNILTITIVVLVFFSIQFSANKLIAIQKKKIVEIGNAKINKMIINYKKKYGLKGEIITSYQLLKFIPYLKHDVVNMNNNRIYDKVKNNRLNLKKISYILWMPNHLTEKFMAEINKKSNKYVVVFNHGKYKGGWTFIYIRR